MTTGTLPQMSSGGVTQSDTERLRRIESITDAALTHLDVQDLLDEIVERVREILDADTAAVLLHDGTTDELVATAASGMEQEVRQAVRIPVGQGFEGRVAAARAPVVIDAVEHSDLYSSVLRRRGVRSLAGVPLVSDGSVIGVIHVGSLTPRHFDTHDVDLLRMVADRASLAIEVRRTNVERAAAAALQRSLIPSQLPAIPGLDMAARYLPAGAGGVGGDWYDVFCLPSGRVGVVMGDVIGRGLTAAVVMGRLRSALRAYALDTPHPGEVLERLDRKLQHFETGQMTTVLYCVINASLTAVEVSTAGHPLPMLTVPGAETVTVDAAIDPPLGVDIGVRRRTTVVDLPPGASLAFFTDGLIERRDEPLDRRLEKLRASLSADTAETSCAAAIDTMLGDDDLADDVALLVVRCEDPTGSPPLHIEVPAMPTALGRVRAALRHWLSNLGVGDSNAFNILLAVGEAAANAVSHAYGPGGGTIDIDVARNGDSIVATVRDRGRWRAPRGENRGRGMGIMENCASEVAVDRTDAGTEVRLRFDIDKASS